jgi:shikimate kinase
MSISKTNATAIKIQDLALVWDAPEFVDMATIPSPLGAELRFRLFHVTEISQSKVGAYRLAMANVIASLNDPRCNAIYILSGTPAGVALYIGISSSLIPEDDLHEAAKTLRASFEGNFLGAKLVDIKKGNADVEEMLASSRHQGLITGVPSFNQDENNVGDEDFQGIERLANSLIGETWQLIVVAEPGTDADIRETLDCIYDLSTELSSRQKQSVQRSENTGWSQTDTKGGSSSLTNGTNVSDTLGKSEGASTGKTMNSGFSPGSSSSQNQGASSNQGTSLGTSESHSSGKSDSHTSGTSDSIAKGSSSGKGLSYTSERIDKRVEEIQKHISENLIARFQQGRSKGMFRTAMYVCAKERATYDRLARSVLSIFQGNESTMTPLRVNKLKMDSKSLSLSISQYASNGPDNNKELIYSVPFNFSNRVVSGATWLNTQELSLIAGLPSKELPGLKIRKSVDFALNTADTKDKGKVLTLGRIIQHGRELPHKRVELPLADLTKHVFVTGVTGAGKTTTCMKLLLDSKLPFMVIEPAKTEYRALHSLDDTIEYYILGREDLTPFRLNPFELVSRQESLAGHISTINATLGAVFPMEGAMPYLVEEAIIEAYKSKGWDIHSGDNLLMDDPWEQGSNAWPTFADMIGELDGVIASKKMGAEFSEKYRGSLVGRLTSLTLGVKGRMLNTRHSLDFDKLLDKRVVIELEELKDEQDKALFMGLIISRLAECMKHRHRRDPNFRHLTLIEEAHRLLARPEPGDAGSKKVGVETFTNLLAEVRKYGEGLIIADQIPNKLVSDVIKNTHTKIVHRLFSADDRNTMGDAMGLSDEQKEFLPLLQTGETVIYCGGWHAPVWVKIEEHAKTDRPEIAEEEMSAKGVQQLWAQRARLFPSLSARSEMSNGNILTNFTIDGIKLINMFLSVNGALEDNKKSEYIEKIQKRYSRNYGMSTDKVGVDAATLGTLLSCLFFDCSGFRSTEKTEAIALTALPIAFNALFSSVAELKDYCSDRIGHAILKADVNFKKIESI